MTPTPFRQAVQFAHPVTPMLYHLLVEGPRTDTTAADAPRIYLTVGLGGLLLARLYPTAAEARMLAGALLAAAEAADMVTPPPVPEAHEVP